MYKWPQCPVETDSAKTPYMRSVLHAFCLSSVHTLGPDKVCNTKSRDPETFPPCAEGRFGNSLRPVLCKELSGDANTQLRSPLSLNCGNQQLDEGDPPRWNEYRLELIIPECFLSLRFAGRHACLQGKGRLFFKHVSSLAILGNHRLHTHTHICFNQI